MTLLAKKREIDLVGVDNTFEEVAAFFGLKDDFAKYRRTSDSDYEALRWTLKSSHKNFVISKGNGLIVTELESF